MKKGLITMSRKESLKIHIIQKVAENLISQVKAAEALQCSDRHIRRLFKAYKRSGINALIHQARGRSSPKKIPAAEIQKIVSLYKTRYIGFKPTHFSEMLAENEHIYRSKETIRKIMINYEFWLSKPKKEKHRKQRTRKTHAGMLIQMDGSIDPWFEDRAAECVLMSLIDDATSTVYARFYPYEGTMPALDVLTRYIQKYGIPLALYTDLHQTYHVNNKKMTIEDQLNNRTPITRFESAVQDLGIHISLAYSPQAKGRVERFFGTFQNRLKSELRLHKIASIKDANAFLPSFLARFNKRFAKKHLAQGNIHKDPLPTSVLRNILAIKTERSIANDFTLRHNNHIFQILESTIHKKAIVVETVTGKLFINGLNNKKLKFKLLKKLTHKQGLNIKTKWLTPRINHMTLKEVYV